MLDLKQLLEIARADDQQKWDEALAFLNTYQGDEDDILGARSFLERNQYSRLAFIGFAKQIEATAWTPAKNRLIRIPAWSMAAAASIILTAGLYFNNYVQEKSLHVVEDPMPVYLSADDAAFNKAMSLYKKGEYEKASLLFRDIKTDTACYYMAVSYQMLHYFNLSEEAFKKVEPGSVFYNKARIRLAAIYIDAGRDKQASDMIRNIKPGDADEAGRIKSIKVRLK